MCKLKSELQHSFVVTEPELLYCTLILSVGMCTIPSLCFNTWISWVFALSCSRLYIVLNVCELLVIFLLFVMMTWRRKEINLLIPCPCWSLSSPRLRWSLQTEQASRDRYYLGFKPHRYWVAARGSTHSQEVINQPGVFDPLQPNKAWMGYDPQSVPLFACSDADGCTCIRDSGGTPMTSLYNFRVALIFN
jgi:hypothetical protein